MADEVRRVMAAVLPVFLLSIGQRTAAVELVTEAASAERQPSYPIELFADETGMGSQHIRGWMRVLARKKQMILQGPPGTGKTFLARKLARHLVQNTEGFIETVQFHPAYGYEDFLQGLRPRVEDGHLQFHLESGHFLRFCSEALRRNGAPCVLIIDEINRADLARVFGELMYLLEYREAEIPLAQSSVPFRIPANVYVIGTMNTADRSIARMDHAMRRRFYFVRMDPEYGVLRRHLEQRGLPADGLIAALQGVNEAIQNRDFSVGISYFLQPGIDLRLHLADIWKGEIEPYLEELFLDQRDQVEPHRWETLSQGQLNEWVPR